MARTKNRLLQNFSGTLDDLVFYQVDGETYVRTKPVTYNDRQSLAQLAQRQRLKVVNRFLAPFKKVLRQTFQLEASERKAYGNASSYNMKHSLTGTYPHLSIDKTKVRLSMGPIGLPAHVTIKPTDNGFLMEWDTALTNSHSATDDTFLFFATHPYHGYGYYHFTGVRRSQGRFLWDSNLFEGHRKPDVWIAFRNAEETAVSESWYLE
ncbi:MAG: hypothetical protein JEZ09_20250 [Salinivirgaceae bacterium]|nr:hypothetical protein [Salinivirgaceae bacterium]